MRMNGDCERLFRPKVTTHSGCRWPILGLRPESAVTLVRKTHASGVIEPAADPQLPLRPWPRLHARAGTAAEVIGADRGE